MDAQDAPAAVQPAAQPEGAREHHKSSKHHKKHKRHHKHDHKDHKERKRRKHDHKGANGREPGSPEEGELLPGSAATADAVQLPSSTNQIPRFEGGPGEAAPQQEQTAGDAPPALEVHPEEPAPVPVAGGSSAVTKQPAEAPDPVELDAQRPAPVAREAADAVKPDAQRPAPVAREAADAVKADTQRPVPVTREAPEGVQPDAQRPAPVAKEAPDAVELDAQRPAPVAREALPASSRQGFRSHSDARREHRSSSRQPSTAAGAGGKPRQEAPGRSSRERGGRLERPWDRSMRPDELDKERSRGPRREPDHPSGHSSRDLQRGSRHPDSRSRDVGRRDDRRPSHRDERAHDDRSRHAHGREHTGRDKRKRDDEEDREFVAKVEAALEASQVDEEALLEERRRKRQEILARHGQGLVPGAGGAGTPETSTAAGISAASPRSAGAAAAATPPLSPTPTPSVKAGPTASQTAAPRQPAGTASASTAGAAVATAAISRPESIASQMGEPAGSGVRGGAESPSLSDDEEYQKLDSEALWQQAQKGETAAGSTIAATEEPELVAPENDDRAAAKLAAAQQKEQQQQRHQAPPADGGGLDMFSEEADTDMFAATPVAGRAGAAQANKPRALADNFDDAEGYYNFQVGEIMDGRYEVFATHGKGVFSTVLRARDKMAQTMTGVAGEVAIKMIRANDTMFTAGQTEKRILRKLADADQPGRRHCIKLQRSFEYRGHLCLVFDAMDINLRELTKKYGRGIGLNINAVSKYAAQMLIALYHLSTCGVLHADIKPDNILVSASRTIIKLADFGSAMFTGENDITPYLVSRFYRAPEVILGLRYGTGMDVWSVGCVIYELFTGRILFPGRTNNEMLKLMMDVKGPFPKRMLKAGAFTDKHFESDPNMSFGLLEEDLVTKRPVRRLIAVNSVKKDFAALLSAMQGDKKKVAQLADLLERMMHLDPSRRLTAKECLKHPFIKEPKA